VIENPAGLIDHGEDPEKAALRELEEETGYIPEKLILLSPYIPSSAGLTDEYSYLFLATGCTPSPSGHKREQSEWIDQHELPLSEAGNILEKAEAL
jgi:ADP-ribose pyrophosphatase